MWLSVDPLADKYPHVSPYAYCNNNPVRYIDPDGKDWLDVVVGGVVGVVTNVVPGSASLRDKYTPTDASDYNNMLRATDAAAMATGEGQW